jgi:hypothetical protein
MRLWNADLGLRIERHFLASFWNDEEEPKHGNKRTWSGKRDFEIRNPKSAIEGAILAEVSDDKHVPHRKAYCSPNA